MRLSIQKPKRISQALVLAVSLISLSIEARAEIHPDLADAQVSIKKVIEQKLKREKQSSELAKAAAQFKLKAVHACFPGQGRPKGDYVCSTEGSGRNGDWVEDEVPFHFENGKWIVLDLDGPDEFDPACPSLGEAEGHLRELKKNPNLKVKSDVGEGVGEITADRGMDRDKKGPWRLMCRYSVEVEAGKDEQLMIVYIDYSEKGYSFDPDVEIWN